MLTNVSAERGYMKQYKIGEVARLLGTSTQALRFYEQEGVIVPQKSENGTRYFNEPDVIRLMAFKRFRLIDFTVQDVAQHFTRGSLDSLIDTMEQKKAQMVEQSENLLRRAQAVEKFAGILRLAKESIGQIQCVVRPDIFMHACELGKLDTLSEQQREIFEKFINAMPDAHVCFLHDPEQRQPLRFYFAITQSNAQAWNVPLQDTLRLPAGRCARLFVRADAQLWQKDYLQQQIARVEAAGYTVDRTQMVIGQQLASENAGEKGYLIAAIYIPIL